MTILELLSYQTIPFEIPNIKIQRLLSFFLHSAPTIDSRTAMKIDSSRLCKNWEDFIKSNQLKPAKIYAESYNDLATSCEKNGLGVCTGISRRTKGFTCIRKGKETDYECVLRHIRNSIAHNNVYYCDVGNRKFVLFEDYNKGGKFTARMLFSQTLLTDLKKEITK